MLEHRKQVNAFHPPCDRAGAFHPTFPGCGFADQEGGEHHKVYSCLKQSLRGGYCRGVVCRSRLLLVLSRTGWSAEVDCKYKPNRSSPQSVNPAPNSQCSDNSIPNYHDVAQSFRLSASNCAKMYWTQSLSGSKYLRISASRVHHKLEQTLPR